MQERTEKQGATSEEPRGRQAPGRYRSRALPCALVTALLAASGCSLPDTYVPPRKNAADGFTFYVSPDGDDDDDGLSPERAWRTLRKADAVTYRPGDRLRLRAGARYRGSLSLDEDEAGRAKKPVVVDSYGGGRATIETAGTPGISVYNTAGVEIRDLELVGDDRSFTRSAGVRFFSNLADDRKLSHVVLSGLDISHFRNGVTLAGANRGTGFRDVRISDTAVHGNKDAGISSVGPAFDADDPLYAHEKVSLARVKAYENDGDPKSADRNTGSGIMLGSVRDAKVRRSSAHHNGRKSSSRAEEGPEGIWAYDSTRVVIEHNVSYANRSGSHVDGGGFGLDNNVSSSVLQYNFAFGNDGPGYLLYTRDRNGAHRDNVVRFNLSHDDSRKHPQYGGIVAYGGLVRDLDIYHNTVVMKASSRASEDAPALRLETGLTSARIRNNIFVTDGAPLVLSTKAFASDDVILQGNDYFSTDTWKVRWGAQSHLTLNSWRSADGQEQDESGPTGSAADPCLESTTAPVRSVKGAALMVPGCTDELTAAALNLQKLGVDPGAVDYFGERLAPTAAAGAAQPSSEE
ncbi:right-handed parallel beta-helix repeat-containing protein [Streptomyces finlayi]|uniref:right-handed parallel beta-helix repeat-containing protein n=1 Tax=Streptomyces finlayi TaxID=67296 RepID=UPI0021562EF3|nr:right-handed parallel beta-helix repeat-containing protein [Streptomyces finlayi]